MTEFSSEIGVGWPKSGLERQTFRHFGRLRREVATGGRDGRLRREVVWKVRWMAPAER